MAPFQRVQLILKLMKKLYVSCGRCGYSKYCPTDKVMNFGKKRFMGPVFPTTLTGCKQRLKVFDLYRGYAIDTVFVWKNTYGEYEWYSSFNKCYGCETLCYIFDVNRI